jgi:hypothetical protein
LGPRGVVRRPGFERRSLAFIVRHVRFGPGELDKHDQQANRAALQTDGRILSAFRTSKGDRIWLITEADRSSTCILLPEEY